MSKPTLPILGITLAGVLALLVGSAHAALTTDNFGSGGNAFSIQFTDVGNAGNANDTADGDVFTLGIQNFGAVPYAYRMGVTEVSQDWMTKAGTPGGGAWTGHQPAASITWYQAAAFVNYLNTSTGHQAAYNLDAGATSLTLWTSGDAWTLGGQNLYRHKNAYYFLPSENEWYKAAYHKNDGVTANYWLYPTGSNTAPAAVASGTTAGTAVYDGQPGPGEVSNDGGLSPDGTRGQGGNVQEWQESALDGSNDTSSEDRAKRGGDLGLSEFYLRSSVRLGFAPSSSDLIVGFRVASVPEPSSAVLMIGSGLMLLARRRRARFL